MPTRPDSRRLPLPLLGLALLTGAFTGIGVAVLELVADELLLDSTLARSTPIVVVAPVLGIALAGVALRRLGRGASPANADAFLDAVRRGEELPAEPVAGRTIAATVTLGFGGALGFEGPSFYLGAAIGSAVRRHFSRFARPGDDRALLVAGAAAGVAAILRAPLTGIAFALEAPAHRGPRRPLLVPTAVASVIAWLTFASIFGFDPILPTTGTAALGPRIWFGASVTGLAAGIGARAFAAAVRRAKHLPGRITPRRRLLVGGTLVVAVNTVAVAVLGGPLTVGVGYSVLDWSTAVRRSLGLLLALLVLRALATTLNLAAGGVGGVFIPLLVEGWILGAAVAVIVDDRSLILPVVGAAAFLAAGYHVPLSAVLLVLEASWHPEYVLPAVLAVTVARATVGSRSVSDAQRPLGPGPEDPAPAPE